MAPNQSFVNKHEGQHVYLRPDFLVVEHSVFCGKDMGITIYAHPANMPKWIEEPK